MSENISEFQAVAGETQGHVRLIGELDLATVLEFQAAMEAAPPDGTLTLDLAELTYIDSSGLHAIVECANQLNGRAPVHVVNARDHVLRVLEIVRLDQHENIAVERMSDGR
jgi:anti-anti-sigma factor